MPPASVAQRRASHRATRSGPRRSHAVAVQTPDARCARVIESASTWAALGYGLASRLAYVVYVGIALSRQERSGYFTRRWGTQGGFRRFRRVAALLMINDAVSFVVVCLVGWNTLRLDVPRGLEVATGALLVVLGVVTKVWAARAVGARAFYWHDFFSPVPTVATSTGPYRFLKNPMYTVGYVQTYGFALVSASLVGLVAAVFDQVAILTFYWWVEKPHFDRMHGTRAKPGFGKPADWRSDIASE